MVQNHRFKKASQKEISLYALLGESLCAVQILEDALSHSIVIKKTEPEQKKEAERLLKKHQFYTFGKAINIAIKESLLPKPLEIELSKFLNERNWLIHDSITDNKEKVRSDDYFSKLFERIKTITLKAHELQISIEQHLIEYAEKKGRDMSMVKSAINRYYDS